MEISCQTKELVEQEYQKYYLSPHANNAVMMQILNEMGSKFHIGFFMDQDLLNLSLHKFAPMWFTPGQESACRTILEFWAKKHVSILGKEQEILRMTKEIFFGSFSSKYKASMAYVSRILKVWIRLLEEKQGKIDSKKELIKMNLLPFLLLCTQEEPLDAERKKWAKVLIGKLDSVEPSISHLLDKLCIQSSIENPLKSKLK